MGFLIDSLKSAFMLTASFDKELFEVVFVSLKVSGISTILAGVVGIPMGIMIALAVFKGKKFVITCLNTLLAMPTVVIGLFFYALLSRKGVFGDLGLLYTQIAMIIGQTVLIIPLIASLTISAASKIDGRYRKTAMTLGANRIQIRV